MLFNLLYSLKNFKIIFLGIINLGYEIYKLLPIHSKNNGSKKKIILNLFEQFIF